MFRILGNVPATIVATSIARSAAAACLAALIGMGTAAADSGWIITVTNKGKAPAVVSILLNGSKVGEKSAGPGYSAMITIPPKAGNYTWRAENGGKECGKSSSAISIVGSRSIDVSCEVAAAAGSGSGSSSSGSGSSGGCSFNDIGKDGCPSKAVLEQRKLREQKEGQLRSAEQDLKTALDTVKSAKSKSAIEAALKQADAARKRIAVFRKELGELQPAEKINYTSTLPKEYQDKNPIDVVYDYVSKTVCRGGKLGWDGSIISCQFGDTPDSGNRPIPPATDISPNNPNAR